MNRIKNRIVVFYLLCTLCFGLNAQNNIIKYLSGKGSDDTVEWDFYCTKGRNSGKWTKIKIPSCWETEGFGTYNYGHDKNKANEQGLYKTTFEVPNEWRKKRILIVFEGSMTDTRVKINGRQAGEVHQGAFYRFKRDITGLVRFGKTNLLEVTVDKISANESVNQAERKADFWIFGGIFRPVYLEVVPTQYIDYVSIDAKQHGEIKANIFLSEKMRKVEVGIVVMDFNNQVIGSFSSFSGSEGTEKISVEGKIDQVLPWSCESPNLYQCRIQLKCNGKVLHSINERIGFRTVEVKLRDGVYINGEKIRFKGVNRHSFWPTTGRTTNKTISINDASLIKDMNMNAVRMSHYPPDKHFLEVSDSLGLYVINELCAWQYPPYDTPVGKKLVREMITRDVNHPCIIFWANGNEGGFNYDLDSLFPLYDIQKRLVLHPWECFSGINTVHYINYNSGIKNMFNGRDIFMPTELLHGLYDGGHGAGLDDYWNLMLANPLSAGMFLWDMADQAVVRTDKNGILDTDKDHGADGIMGPYREKEGSFFTVKEIWSPVFVEKKYITPSWDGCFTIENRYNFTNTNECSFTYRLARINELSGERGITRHMGSIIAPDIKPGEKGTLALDLPDDWRTYDVLYVTATDKFKRELYTWSYELVTPDRFAQRCLPANTTKATVSETADEWQLSAGDVKVVINKKDGLLHAVYSKGKLIPLSNGPVLITERSLACKSVKLKSSSEGNPSIAVEYTFQDGNKNAYSFSWTMSGSGILKLEYRYRPRDRVKMAGITFGFPEEGITGATLLANGPYRVYNNRLKGGTLNVWKKKYNNTITGESWEYPEFKGYYSLFYGMKLACPTPFEVYCGTEDIFLHLFTPEEQKGYSIKGRPNFTQPEYPKGNISFLDAIPSVGTKFGAPEEYGPQSHPHRFKGFGGEANFGGTLYLKF